MFGELALAYPGSLPISWRGFSDISWISRGGVVPVVLKLGFLVRTPYSCARMVHKSDIHFFLII